MKTTLANSKLKNYYYITMCILIIFMVVGLFADNQFVGTANWGFIIHAVCVVLLSAAVLLYPAHQTRKMRWFIVLIALIYFYTMLIIYPETGSTMNLIYFIPAISILFFDKQLFNSSVAINTILMIGSILYIVYSGKASLYPAITDDIIGNIINFLGSQVILYFIFHMTSFRINKMQLYYEQIKHAERLKTTGQLAAAVAHEIRNPLTVVKGYLELYEQEAMGENKIKQNLPLLINELKSAEQVISQLLSLSKPSQHLVERVEVKKAIYGVTDLLQSYGLLNKSTLDVSVDDQCSIEMNKIELHQLLVNIIKNAIEASDPGGTIFIKVGTTGEKVEIQVVDQGVGMSEEELAFLGTPFYSLKNKGTGLGVTICQSIVKKHNGTIQYESVKGKGTKVTIRFPAKK